MNVHSTPLARRAPSLLPSSPSEPPLWSSSFTALLLAVQAVASRPSSPAPPNDITATTTDANTKEDARRARNRVACRKARLTRKLRRTGEALRLRQREEWRAYLLDVRDELAHAPLGLAAAVVRRAFVVRSLHYCLVDAEYMASKRSTRGRVAGWPARTVLATMIQQWNRIIDDLVNVDLSLDRISETASASDDATLEIVCAWTLTGVRQSVLTAHQRLETTQIRGISTLRFVNNCTKMIELTAIETTTVDSRSNDDDEDVDDDE